MLILHGGRIAYERYWGQWDEHTAAPIFSITKSVTSLLVGAAIDDGLIRGIEQPTADFIEEWRGTTHEKLRLRHHLSMTTGLAMPGKEDNGEHSVTSAQSDREVLVNLPFEATPGSKWKYNTFAYRVLFYVLEQASGQPLETYSRARLLEPIGAADMSWYGQPTETASNLRHLNASARDLARIGLLVLRKGRWGDSQIVSERFIEQTLQPSNTFNPWYGFLFWLNSGDTYMRGLNKDVYPGPLYPRAPRDTIACLGKGDAKIWLIPSQDLVIVRLGGLAEPNTSSVRLDFGCELIGRICEAVEPSFRPSSKRMSHRQLP